MMEGVGGEAESILILSSQSRSDSSVRYVATFWTARSSLLPAGAGMPPKRDAVVAPSPPTSPNRKADQAVYESVTPALYLASAHPFATVRPPTPVEPRPTSAAAPRPMLAAYGSQSRASAKACEHADRQGLGPVAAEWLCHV